MQDVQLLCGLVGYLFRDPGLLQRALTHRSYAAENNERLEFLGDGLLNLIIAEALFRRFPELKEGELSRMRAELVNGVTLAELARDFRLGDFLRLGTGEKNAGGRERDSILADAVEALIGAIYLDSDFDLCRQQVLNWFSRRLQSMNPRASHKDAKTRLQEFLQARKLALPVYELADVSGADHQQIFTVSCRIEMLNRPLQATGTSRRKAEQAVAEAALGELQAQHKF